MPDFEVKISTPVELSGAKQLEEQLERDIGKAKALGQSTDELAGKLKAVRSAIANAGEGAKEGGEGFKVLGHGAHEAHAALRGMEQIIPGVDQLARFLANSLTASIGAGVIVFEKMKEQIEECDKVLDDLANNPDAQGEWVDKLREAADRASVSFQLWENGLARTAQGTSNLRTQVEELLTAQRESIGAENEIAQAQKALEEARVDLAVKLGQITPEQAIKIKLDLDVAAFKQQAEIKLREIQAELSARANEVLQSRNNSAAAALGVRDTEAAARAAEAAKIKNEGKLAREAAKKNGQLQADLAAQSAKIAQLEDLQRQTAEAHAEGSMIDADERARQHGTPQSWSQTSGPALPGTIQRARAAIDVAGQHISEGRGSDGEIAGIINELIGLVRDQHATAAQRSELQSLTQEVKDLRRRITNGSNPN